MTQMTESKRCFSSGCYVQPSVEASPQDPPKKTLLLTCAIALSILFAPLTLGLSLIVTAITIAYLVATPCASTKKIDRAYNNAQIPLMQNTCTITSRSKEILELKDCVSEVLGNPYEMLDTVEVSIKDTRLKEKLKKASPGDWIKVYEAGLLKGNKVEVHYFKNTTSGKLFSIKKKYDYFYQSKFKNIKI